MAISLAPFGAALALAGLLLGCAGAPPPPPPPPVAYRCPRCTAAPRRWPWSGPWASSPAPPTFRGDHPPGVDCSGLIQALYQRTGVTCPAPWPTSTSAGRPVGPGELRFGDVVFFNRYCQTRGRDVPWPASSPFRRRGLPQRHLPGRGPLHACFPPGRIISRLDAEVWRVSYRGARRFLP